MYSVGTEVPTSRSTNILPELLNIKDKFGAALNYTVNQMGIDNISDAFNETLYRFNLIEMKHGIFLDANHDDDWYWVYSGYGSNAAFQAEVNLTISGEYITITKHIRYPLVVNVTGGGTTPPANNPPNTPSRPSGPTSGNPGISYTYTTSTTDPDGDDVYYWFDWGDGKNSGWVGPYSSGETGSASHSWDTPGTYYVKVKAKDTKDAESKFSESLEVRITSPGNNPPDTPKISGPKEGVVGEEYTFTAVTDDPDGDQIKYGWDWNGDGTVDEWSSKYFESGKPCSMQHSWDTEGTYYVKVKAKDTKDAESEFSEGWKIVIKEKK